jgi:hypothetical protein
MYRTRRRCFPIAATLLSLLVGCGSNSGQATGGVVVGALDSHCQSGTSPKVAHVDPAACHMTGTGMDGGMMSMDGGMMSGMDGGASMPQYGDTMFNSQGADDDCKYNLTFTVSPVSRNTDETFTLKMTYLADGSPVAGAGASVEASLSSTHPAPNSGQRTTESPAGTYGIGPVRFDAPGRWTVRFHLFEDCNDSDTSPHGHAAFFVDVP